MSLILTFAEFSNGGVGKPALEVLGEARRQADASGARVGVVLVGQGVEAGAATLGRYGADEVFSFDHAELASYNLERYAAAVQAVVEAHKPDVLLFPGTVHGRELAPWLAARLDVGSAADCVAITVAASGALSATRPMYSGKVRTTVSFDGARPQIASLRPNIFATGAASEGRTATVHAMSSTAAAGGATLTGTAARSGGKVELTEARVVVAGGRGMKGPEHFPLLDELAGVLGAAVGASRMVVDLGWVGHSMQVGQTGKLVNPELYIAVGISGAIQHVVGMQTSKVIVAINKDADAPIFKIADYGIVADAFEVLPALTQELKAALAPVSV